jgi:hypothetical protein
MSKYLDSIIEASKARLPWLVLALWWFYNCRVLVYRRAMLNTKFIFSPIAAMVEMLYNSAIIVQGLANNTLWFFIQPTYEKKFL